MVIPSFSYSLSYNQNAIFSTVSLSILIIELFINNTYLRRPCFFSSIIAVYPQITWSFSNRVKIFFYFLSWETTVFCNWVDTIFGVFLERSQYLYLILIELFWNFFEFVFIWIYSTATSTSIKKSSLTKEQLKSLVVKKRCFSPLYFFSVAIFK